MNAGASMLRFLRKQYYLTMSDFKEEIGSKCSVSMICNENWSLTKGHIGEVDREKTDISTKCLIIFIIGHNDILEL